MQTQAYKPAGGDREAKMSNAEYYAAADDSQNFTNFPLVARRSTLMPTEIRIRNAQKKAAQKKTAAPANSLVCSSLEQRLGRKKTSQKKRERKEEGNSKLSSPNWSNSANWYIFIQTN